MSKGGSAVPSGSDVVAAVVGASVVTAVSQLSPVNDEGQLQRKQAGRIIVSRAHTWELRERAE